MKVLMINGSPHGKGSTYTALHEMETVYCAHALPLWYSPPHHNYYGYDFLLMLLLFVKD